MPQDWSWSEAQENGDLVVKQVDAIAIYTNTNGEIVIRQRNTIEEDSLVVFPKEYADSIISAIKDQESMV